MDAPSAPSADPSPADPASAGRAGHHAVEMPRLTTLLRHALPRFVEGVIAPVAVFYAAFALLGLNGGLAAAVTWVYGGIAWRWWRGHGVSAMLVLAALGVTVRAALAAATHSAVVYFLQPTLGTLTVSMAFLASVPLRRPSPRNWPPTWCRCPRRSCGTSASGGSSCASRCCGRWSSSPTR
ncbi:DUF3159 domain-containing protein [Actinomadura keratinilytica]|uniref:hypothetical protein n=1 Tax=Actinomadura keratinilytica TaxID=547461 RepID=UPI003622F81D